MNCTEDSSEVLPQKKTMVITMILPENAVESKPNEDIDIRKLLNLVQNQQGRNKEESISSSSDSSDSDDRDDGEASSAKDYTRSTRTREDNIMKLINKIINENNNHRLLNNNQNRVNRVPSNNKNNNRYINSQYNRDVAQILDNYRNKLKYTDAKRQTNTGGLNKNLTPNRLLGYIKDSQDRDDNIDEKSRVYVILKPEVLQQSKSSNDAINNLVHRLLSLPSSNRIGGVKKSQISYKGLGRRRASGEALGGDSEEKPKRVRVSGIAGRTAIPNVRHRGENIYEKD